MKRKFSVFGTTVVKLQGTITHVVGENDDNMIIEGHVGLAKGYGKVSNNDRKQSHMIVFLFDNKSAYPLGYFKTKLHRDVAFQYLVTGSRLQKEVVLMKSTFMGSLPIEDVMIDLLAENVNLDTLLSSVSNDQLKDVSKLHSKTWLSVKDIREVANTKKSLLHWTPAQDKAFYAFMATLIESPFPEWNSMDIMYTLYYINEDNYY